MYARVEGSIFDENFANGNGGAVSSVDTCLLSMAGCVFTNNVASNNGGAIHALMHPYEGYCTLDEELLAVAADSSDSVYSPAEMQAVVDTRRLGTTAWG